jgi:hypothetical protein
MATETWNIRESVVYFLRMRATVLAEFDLEEDAHLGR